MRQVIITRHDNRRFYHDAQGRYVSLEQLRAMAADKEAVLTIQDADGRDITGEIIKLSRH